MKRWLPALVAAMLLLGGCSVLPGEDRAFAVAMGVSETGGVWEVSVRLPTYQTGGGYMTLTARGNSLGEAMALLNASAPMELHYGQLRLLLFAETLAESDRFQEILRALAARGEVRPQAVIAVTPDNVPDVMDALEPATGSRLSKSLESLMKAREKAGVAELVTLEEWQRMGQRQQVVLMNAAMESAAANTVPGMDATAGEQAAKGAGKVQFSGGWMASHTGAVKGELTAMEMQLLSLLKGKTRQGVLSLPEGTLTLLDAKCSITLEGQEVQCSLRVRYSASDMTEEGAQAALISSLQSLTGKLGKAGCDALGVGRKAMLGRMTMEDWKRLNWPETYPALTWRFTVKAEREA
ncbi:MAG: hypothetical protein E7316_02170 [Clostridiales bacterium]|nr:hypothetical protein [Clostridiales bacterium]